MTLPTTASQTIGPFLHLGLAWLVTDNLVGAGVTGERVTVEGRIVDGDGKPVSDAIVEIWQANAHGRYAHPDDVQDKPLEAGFKGFGRVPTDDDGSFRFATIKPGRVPAPRPRLAGAASQRHDLHARAPEASLSRGFTFPAIRRMPRIPRCNACRQHGAARSWQRRLRAAPERSRGTWSCRARTKPCSSTTDPDADVAVTDPARDFPHGLTVVINFIGVLFDGIAYGSLLFLISIGLSVTMGLMNFVNLAHGAFAMVGGYVCVTIMTRLGMPFLATLPVAFLVAAVVGIVLERTLYQRLYKATHLDQVLFSIGIVFMAIAGATYIFGPAQQPVLLPEFLKGQVHVLGLDLGAYRLFLIAIVVVITIALTGLIERTRFGAQIRASVDNQQASAGLGINVNRVFGLTFALGSGLAGLGGALGIDVLGLEPTFPIKYMVYFLLVVAVGGAGTIKGPLVAALLLGVFDVAGKYYVPQIGAFVIYALMVVLLIIFPAGLYGRKN